MVDMNIPYAKHENVQIGINMKKFLTSMKISTGTATHSTTFDRFTGA